MTSKVRSAVVLLATYVAFFASGAGSLVAEVTWNRMLIVVVGNSMSAVAMIVVVFMGGLGVGSHLGGRILGRRPPSLMPYVALEMIIGVYVLLSPSLFELLSRLFTFLAESGGDRSHLTAVRTFVTLAALFVPAVLMGATYPAIVSGTEPRAPSRGAARAGYLYSVNTVGAALGCFAAGYHLLLEFGVRTTLNCAFGLYLVAILSALAAHAAAASEPREAAKSAGFSYREREHPVSGGHLRRFLFVATFGVGFVALSYEVLLTRVSILFLGNTVSVFPLVLTGFLLGTGLSAVLGTWVYGVLCRYSTAVSNRLFGFTALAAGGLVLATPYLLLTDRVIGIDQLSRLADAAPRNPLPILGLIVAPTIMIGALLPMAIRMLEPGERGETTRGAAALYALNTAGGVLGAGLANHFLVPLVGVQGVLVGLASICAVVGVAGLVSPGRSFRRKSIAFAGIVSLVAVPVAGLPPLINLYADKIAESTQAQSVKVRLVYEGRAATVTVLDQGDPRRGTYRDMYLNGVEEASTRYWHTQLFKLLGILPVLVHESAEPKEVLVIAFGAGITAGSVLASDRVRSVDVVDLNPDVESINDLFAEVNGDVFHNPKFRFRNDDGRNYLVTSNKRYDVIVGDSTHPRAYDSWILYTEEFYRAVRRHLRPGGVFAQWVPVLRSMQGDLFRIHLNTFRSVFPNSTLWYVYGSDQAFLMSVPEPFSLNTERLNRQLRELPRWFDAEKYQIDTVPRISGFFWLDEPAMEKMIGAETRVNRDDFHYFDKQSAVRPAPPSWRLPWFQASILPYLKPADGELRKAVRDEQAMAQSLSRYGFFHNRQDLFRAYCAMPENGNARYWMSLEFSGIVPRNKPFCEDERIRGYWTVLSAHPGNARAMNALADSLADFGELDEALALAEAAVTAEPGNGMILDTYGWVLFLRGNHSAALEILAKSALLLPDQPIVLYHLGTAHLAAGNADPAKAYLARALSISGSFPGAEEARRLLAKHD